MKGQIQREIEAIGKDNLSGSVSLCERAARVFLDLIADWSPDTGEQLYQEVLEVGKGLIAAQPEMVLIRRLVNELLYRLRQVNNGPGARDALRRGVEEFLEGIRRGSERIVEEGAKLITSHSTVVTHSYSSTVQKALLRARSLSVSYRVICLEARPLGEGVSLAEELAAAGIEVTLIADSAIFQLMPRVDLVLVGGDAVTPGGLINKIGTAGLALAAREKGVPFYALCHTEKIWPQVLSEPLETHTKPAQQLYPKTVEGISVLNFYFDQTPLEWITGLVTERGVMTSRELVDLFSRIWLTPELRTT